VKSAIWPSRDDYQIVVRQPERHLKDRRLHGTQVETRVLGVPFPRSGNFGAVYKFSNSREAYALKVFDKAQKDRQLRYKLIDEHLKRQPASANLLSFSYDEEGILVNGHWYPALFMDWAVGKTLDVFITEALQQAGNLANGSLCQTWVNLVLDLGQRHVAHGDLQHGNILVAANGAFKLVDYDGMFVPSMRERGLTAAEIGLPAYQHPKRWRGYFDERLDDFTALVILLSLACVNRARWQTYHNDDNILVVAEADLVRPEASPLLGALSKSPDAPLRKLAAILRAASKGGLDNIPSFSKVIADPVVKQALAPSWRPAAVAGEQAPSTPPRKVRPPVTPPPVTPPPVKPPPVTPPPVIPTVSPPPAAPKSGSRAGVLGSLTLIGVAIGIVALVNYQQNLRKPGPRPTPTATPSATWWPSTPSPSTPLPTPATPLPTPEFTPQFVPTPSPPAPSTPSMGTLIRSVWLQHDYPWGGATYMVIHCNFQVSAADTTSRRARVVVYFYLSNRARMRALLRGTYRAPDGQAAVYYSNEGQAAVAEVANVTYDPATTWPDFPLYMRVDGLARSQNSFGIVQIQDLETNRVLATAQTPTFSRN
jgi:serine/threonine protein kinase